MRYQLVNKFSINSKAICFRIHYTYYLSAVRSLAIWAFGSLPLLINSIPVVRTPFFFLQWNGSFVFGLFDTIRQLSSYIQTYNYLLNRCLIITLRSDTFYIHSYFYPIRWIFEHFQEGLFNFALMFLPFLFSLLKVSPAHKTVRTVITLHRVNFVAFPVFLLILIYFAALT